MNKLARSKVVIKIAVLGILSTIIVITLVPRLNTIWELREKKARLLERKAVLEEKHQILQEEKNWLESSRAVEQIAREQLGMVKEGEKPLLPIANY